jgi:hypothetical protein
MMGTAAQDQEQKSQIWGIIAKINHTRNGVKFKAIGPLLTKAVITAQTSSIRRFAAY